MSRVQFVLRQTPDLMIGAAGTFDCEPSEDTVRTAIKTLRKKISDANEDCAIKTTLGFGYRLEVSN